MAITTSLFTWFDKGIKHIKPEIFLTDDIKVCLLTASYTPNAATHEFYDVSITNELTTANGYTAGGESLASKTLTETTAGVWAFDSTDPLWNVTGSSITAKMFVLYNNTPASSKPLIGYGYLDYNSGTPQNVVVLPGVSLSIILPATGWFTSNKVNA